jgi:hypothetical protein
LIPLSVFFSRFIAIQVLGSNNISAFQIKKCTQMNETSCLVPITTHLKLTIERILSFH